MLLKCCNKTLTFYSVQTLRGPPLPQHFSFSR